MIKELEVDLKVGDEVILKDVDSLKLCLERNNCGYSLVVKSRDKILSSEFFANETLDPNKSGELMKKC